MLNPVLVIHNDPEPQVDGNFIRIIKTNAFLWTYDDGLCSRVDHKLLFDLFDFQFGRQLEMLFESQATQATASSIATFSFASSLLELWTNTRIFRRHFPNVRIIKLSDQIGECPAGARRLHRAFLIFY